MRAAVAILIFSLALTASARADDSPGKAYAAGAAAMKKGEYKSAAIMFARADEIAPSDVALLQAMEAAELADDPPLAMALAERASRAPSLAATAKRLGAKFGVRAGKIVVSCPGSSTCALRIDGNPVAEPTRGWVAPGTHEVVIVADGREEARPITLLGGTVREVTPTPLVPPAPVPSSVPAPAKPTDVANEPRGLSPAVFFVCLTATAVLGIATGVSALDLRSKRDTFEREPTPESQAAGRSAELRSNVLLITTSVALVSTAAIGLFAVRWSSGTATVALSGSTLRLAVTF